MLPLMKLSLRRYPNTYKAIAGRHVMYNRTRDFVFEQEKRGNAFVICQAEKLPIGRVEHDPENLQRVYDLGRQEAERCLEALQSFLREG